MIIGLYHPVVGGAEKVCLALSKSLSERGIPVAVLTQRLNGVPDYDVIDGIPVHRKMKWWHPFGMAYMLSVLIFLVRYRRRYDIIHCFGLFLFLPPALLMKYVFKKKVVLRLLCSGPYGDFAGIEKLKLARWILGSAQRADRIIYMSRDMKDELLEHRFSEEKLINIANGVDSRHFKPPADPHAMTGNTICFVGRLETQKGLGYLLRACAKIIQDGCNAKLLVVGAGRQKELLEDLSKHLGIDEHVIFTGFAEDALPYYQQARLFVLPSLSEGMSSALLEAMSCGLAVIATGIGASDELIGASLGEKGLSRGQYRVATRGIVVNPHDEKGLSEALGMLIRDAKLSKLLGGSARDFVMKSYSHESMVSAYQDLYTSVCKTI